MSEECLLFPGAGGGMDQDTSEYSPLEEFSKGSYRYALNFRVGNTSKNQTDAGENIPSTLLVSAYLIWNGSAWVTGSAPSGTNVAINKYSDSAEGKVYWFVKNSGNNHTILMFVKSERKIYELLKWSGLNFSNFISCTKINKYLIFTDGNPADGTGNPPRIIDVTTIYTLKNTLGASFSEYHISFAKWAPVAPPTVDNVGESTGNVFIAKGVYQFAYRYVYVGGFRSCWSPPSNFVSNQLLAAVNTSPDPLPGTPTNFRVLYPGFVFDFNTPASTAFSHTDPRFYYFVDSIELAYRDSEIANWKVFKRYTWGGSSSFDIQIGQSDFKNSGPVVNVADNDIGQYFDSVPILSRSVEAIDNRPMFGNNLDDLPPLDNFAVTDVAVYSIQPVNASAGTPVNTWFDYSGLATQLTFQKFSFKENGVYKLGIIFKHYDGRSGLVQTLDEWTYTIPALSVGNTGRHASQEDFHALGFKIANGVVPPIWAVDYQIVRTNCLNIDFFILGQVNDFKFLKLDNSGTDSSLTTPDEIQSAISSYYDSYSTGGGDYPLINRILTAVRKNQLASPSDVADNASLIYMDIKNWCLDSPFPLTGASGGINTQNSLFYNWKPGDRVRFWSSTASDYSGPYVQHDQEILQYTGTAIIVAKPIGLKHMGNRTKPSVLYAEQLFGIEVYRPKKYSTDNDVIYYEMGEWYPVLQPGTNSRAFSKTDFTWVDTASVTVTTSPTGQSIYNKFPIINGDVWLVYKNFFWYDASLVTGFLLPYINNPWTVLKDYPVFPQMNQDRFNAAGFWEHNTGRPLASYKYLPKQFDKSTQIRFGGKFLEDSIFISINNFQDANQKIYPSEYGKIRAMVNTSNTQVKDVGQILMVICEEETMDVYVNRATLQSLGGQTQVTLTDQVLGSYNTLLGSYGTLNPESVSKRNSRVLFWNAKRGMWIRRSIDGLTPVSNYKMQNWFKDLSNLLIGTYATGTPAQVLSVFDPYYEEWVTYINHSSLPGTYRGYSSYKSASFDEDSKRWNTVYDYTPELFASLENEVYSIIGVAIHIHYAGADYGSIYGVKKDCMWQPVANALFRETKVWRAINQQATDKWSFPNIDADFRSNGVVAQNSALLLTDLVNLEGTYWADIKRDLNTVNAPNSNEAIVNGDPMRSRALTLMLKLDPSVTWYSFINWLVVTFDRSEKTVKK